MLFQKQVRHQHNEIHALRPEVFRAKIAGNFHEVAAMKGPNGAVHRGRRAKGALWTGVGSALKAAIEVAAKQYL